MHYNYIEFLCYIPYRTKSLTWHEGGIPQNEIWIKLGGDKGGSSFKMSFQVANVKNPNSSKNTFVFCLFEAPDTVTNLNIALQQYKKDVEEMQSTNWKYV